MRYLYDHPFSIVPWRVRIALHEKQLSYETIQTNLFSKSATEQFLTLNPFAQIPVLEDNGFVVSESIAILEYLEEQYPQPPLLPTDAKQRARVRNLLCWGGDYWPSAWKKWMAPRLPEALADPWDDKSVAQGKVEICHHLDVIENQLTLVHGPWLVGTFSLADIGYAPFVLVLDRVELGDEVSKRPHVSAWVKQLLERPSIIATAMPDN